MEAVGADDKGYFASLLGIDSSELNQESIRLLRGSLILMNQDTGNGRMLSCVALVEALGQIARFNPISMPLSYSEPKYHIQHSSWVKEANVAQALAQFVYACRPDDEPQRVKDTAEYALITSATMSLLEQSRHDAWVPGMESGSGWTKVFRVTSAGRDRVARALNTDVPKTSVPRYERGEWLSVTEAAELLINDVSGIDLDKAKARVSKAATEKRFRTNGISGRDRRIDRDSFSTWRLEQRENDLDRQG
ncbi:MAG: hypothetical protein KF757_05630 [Phycisphaeraceae bacterium]|nr:hypothetical protein [Phycisphaeraceae bacterium]